MPGIFHAFFGCTLGLLVWKLSEEKNGEKRISLPLIFVFVINNYIGPDIGGIFKGLGDALGSPPFEALGSVVHSYAGFILFALPYAVAWYAILLGIELARARRLQRVGIGPDDPGLHASYSKVLLMVIAGGIMHHFVDSIGHSPRNTHTPGTYYPTGRFILIPKMTADFWLAYVVTLVTIAIAVVVYLLIGVKRKRFVIKQKVVESFTHETIKALFYIGVVVLNVVLMYGLMAYGDLVVINDGNVMFHLGNLLRASQIMFEESAVWWIAITAGPTIVLFILSHARAWQFQLARRAVRVDFFVLVCFICALAVGYLLQPLIGNISGTEADAGALVYTWATLGSALLAFLLARSDPRGNAALAAAK